MAEWLLVRQNCPYSVQGFVGCNPAFQTKEPLPIAVFVIRDYHMRLWPALSTQDLNINPRADNGRGLILRAMTKTQLMEQICKRGLEM